MPGVRVLALVTLLSLAGGGCSFVFVRGPAASPAPGVRPRCTALPVAPAIDTALAGLAIYGSISAARTLSGLDEEDRALNRDFLRIQRDWAAVGALFEVGAAVYGFVKTTRCRRARAAFDAAAR